MIKSLISVVCSLCVIIPAVTHAQASASNTPHRTVITPTLRAAIDTTVSPCHDFDQYANGAWRTDNDSSNINMFEDARSRVDEHLIRILESAKNIAPKTKDPALRTLGMFYTSCLLADSLPRARRVTPSRRVAATRAEECVVLTEQTMGPALNYAYMQDVMLPKVASHSRTLVANIRTSVREHVQSLAWIGDSMQQRFTTVLDTMTMRMQFAPDTLKNYSTLVLDPNRYTANVAAITAWERAEYLRHKDSMPIRRTAMEPPLLPYSLVAQARRGAHVIEVATFFFQPPFFDITAEPAANYATLGVILAHEMWHLLTPYFKWTNNTDGRRRASLLVESYAEFKGSGWNTVNEDFSDIGGLLAAYAAWQKDGRKTEIDRVEGFTPEQRFFLYYARLWRSRAGARPDGAHSVMSTRVNGVLMYVPAFASAFGCTESDEMVVPREKRADIF